MTWIETIAPGEAVGPLREFYEATRAARGGVAAVHQAQSLNPRALVAHFELYKAVCFQRSSLDRRARERIAVVVSRENGCDYCVAHHAEALRQAGQDGEVVDALAAGRLPTSLPEQDRLLLVWTTRIATTPADCTEDDVRRLRAAGWEDRALLDAALTAAYFAFVNRLVLALGVALESDYAATCREPAPGGDPT